MLLLVENSYRSELSFPSGGIKSKESPKEAASRELCEEVGLKIALEDIKKVFEKQVDHDNMMDMVTVFEVSLESDSGLELDRREVVAARFVTEADAPKLNIAAVVKEYLAQR
jgi:ADP-ribose pyrophosphatase YjhB (NUDIX family)